MSGALERRATQLDEIELLGILGNLELAGSVTPVSLDLAEPDLSLDRFLDLCTYFGALRNATAWWVADLLNLGDFLHGFEASQAEAVLGRDPETLRRWQWVATKVQKSRRNPRLSFSHHEEVAKLDPAEQIAWLARAEDDRLTVRELRAHIKHSCSTSNTSGAPESATATQPNPTSTEALGGREAGADGLTCPTCGRPLPEQRRLVEVEPKRKGEPGS